MNSRDNKHGAEIDDSPDNSGSAGYVRHIPKPLYPCMHCAEEYSWPAEDLSWSKREMGWVCDLCWDDRDVNWDGDDCIDEDKGISLAEELNRQNRLLYDIAQLRADCDRLRAELDEANGVIR